MSRVSYVPGHISLSVSAIDCTSDEMLTMDPVCAFFALWGPAHVPTLPIE